MIAAMFLGMAHGYSEGAHIRVTFLMDRIPRGVKVVVNHIVQAFSIPYGVRLFIGAYQQTLRTMDTGMNLGSVEIPRWPAYAIVTAGLFFMSLSMLLVGANIFGIFMALSRVPQHGVAVVTEMDLNRWVVIIGIVVVYFIISMFMDEIPLLLLTLQLTFPLIIRLGFDPIWFGVLSVMMVCMGLVFPPVGLVAFVVSATAKLDLLTVCKGTGVLMVSIVIATVLLMFFPGRATWLPATMR
jgi:hypothetical protein